MRILRDDSGSDYRHRQSSCGVQTYVTNASLKAIGLSLPQSKEIISSTIAHTDFVKCLFVFPALRLLISGGSDKVIKFWYAFQRHTWVPTLSALLGISRLQEIRPQYHHWGQYRLMRVQSSVTTEALNPTTLLYYTPLILWVLSTSGIC